MPVKSVPIKLDKQRRLCFDFNAFAELDDQCEISFWDLQQIFAGKFECIQCKKELSFRGVIKVDGKLLCPKCKGTIKPKAKKIGLKIIRDLIWAGLLHENPSITRQEVGRIIDEIGWAANAQEIMSSVTKAILESSFVSKESKKKAVKPEIPRERTGARRTTSKKAAS